MEETSKKKKVLCPVEKEGKTHWRMLGTAFVNRDSSINIYLDGLPTNGKLQLRDWDEPDRRAPQGNLNLRSVNGAQSAAQPRDEDLPF